ncbi:zinc finger CCHC domain-containing protein 13-like [Sergentomyia squamirostris]
MPKAKKKYPKIKPYAKKDVQAALKALKEGLTVRQAAKTFRVPRQTLLNRLSRRYSDNQTFRTFISPFQLRRKYFSGHQTMARCGVKLMLPRECEKKVRIGEKLKKINRVLRGAPQKMIEQWNKFSGDDFHYVESFVDPFLDSNTCKVEKWISDFENVVSCVTSDDRFHLICARRLLRETANTFLRTVNVATWKELRAAFLSEFGRRHDDLEIYDRLRNRVKTPYETNHEYVLRMQEIALRAHVLFRN